ncbi:MAG: hypothetical protein NT062_08555, partial [Proteobacteria bacterium]|nr:hypothetical protein [Pseudomonadota bacterium]
MHRRLLAGVFGVLGVLAPTVVRAELVDTVATITSRTKLSEVLVAPAQQAVRARAWARAIPLYQALVVARGPGSPEARQLATLWSLAGQTTAAAEAW